MTRVYVACRNSRDDRIIPRMARYLAEELGWRVGPPTKLPNDVDVIYLLAYFESQLVKKFPPRIPIAAYFTHREEQPPNNSKARLFDRVAAKVDLRIATCRIYTDMLEEYGPTIQAAAPLERDRFVVPRQRRRSKRLVAGFSGYTYPNHRKGEDLVRVVLKSGIGQRLDWKASGRGWPVPTRRYRWAEMPKFYQGLDILVVPSRVEGIPMPTLEALACGVSVVIPRGVGLHDELPEILGIHRFDRGDAKSLVAALEEAVEIRDEVNPEALREATSPYSVEQWVDDHRLAFGALSGEISEELTAGISADEEVSEDALVREQEATRLTSVPGPVERNTGSTRGIFCVAFGEPARACAQVLIASIRKHMPDIPVCLCGAKPLGTEDVFVEQEDSDIGGRRAKLRAYELSPAEWQAVLYLDADTEVVAPIYQYFEWIEDGWEFVICKDPHLMDTLHAFRRANNAREVREIRDRLGTLNALQYNGGVWSFGRNERIARFFVRWQKEWERHAQRDQGALIRAMYTDPLRVLVLGNEWNTFPKYTKGIRTAGLMHYPGRARRWKGLIPGRIDSDEAWRRVREWERKHGVRSSSRRGK